MTEWAPYPDSTLRETYPPAPRSGGQSNKEASETVVATITQQHLHTVHQEAEFRARQRARRLQTRGAQAMRDPEELLPQPIEDALPDDPAVEIYKVAGWLR